MSREASIGELSDFLYQSTDFYSAAVTTVTNSWSQISESEILALLFHDYSKIRLYPINDAPYRHLEIDVPHVITEDKIILYVAERQIIDTSLKHHAWSHNEIDYRSMEFQYNLAPVGQFAEFLTTVGPFSGLLVLGKNPARPSWELMSFSGEQTGWNDRGFLEFKHQINFENTSIAIAADLSPNFHPV